MAAPTRLESVTGVRTLSHALHGAARDGPLLLAAMPRRGMAGAAGLRALTMPWGKYRGEEVADLPSSYLVWLAEEATALSETLRFEVLEVLAERYSYPAPPAPPPPRLPAHLRPVAHELIDAGVRGCARKRHPDVGGTHEAMLELEAAAMALRRLV